MDIVKSVRSFTLRLALVIVQAGLILAGPQVPKPQWQMSPTSCFRWRRG